MENRLKRLEPFVGEWDLEAFGGHARVTFEWLSGQTFLVERWEVPVPEAPDGIAIIGFDEGRDTFIQHYFDSRGVARVYEMGLEDGRWTLSRSEPDFSPLDFAQRFEGRFSEDARTIAGRWEIDRDGSGWKLDFELTYRKVGGSG